MLRPRLAMLFGRLMFISQLNFHPQNRVLICSRRRWRVKVIFLHCRKVVIFCSGDYVRIYKAWKNEIGRVLWALEAAKQKLIRSLPLFKTFSYFSVGTTTKNTTPIAQPKAETFPLTQSRWSRRTLKCSPLNFTNGNALALPWRMPRKINFNELTTKVWMQVQNVLIYSCWHITSRNETKASVHMSSRAFTDTRHLF